MTLVQTIILPSNNQLIFQLSSDIDYFITFALTLYDTRNSKKKPSFSYLQGALKNNTRYLEP